MINILEYIVYKLSRSNKPKQCSLLFVPTFIDIFLVIFFSSSGLMAEYTCAEKNCWANRKFGQFQPGQKASIVLIVKILKSVGEEACAWQLVFAAARVFCSPLIMAGIEVELRSKCYICPFRYFKKLLTNFFLKNIGYIRKDNICKHFAKIFVSQLLLGTSGQGEGAGLLAFSSHTRN